MGLLRHGTSSWSEKSWAGVVYPPGLPPREWLAHYATLFDTVEADTTYYRVPDARLVDGWRERTPEGFTLAAKFPRSIVHCGQGPQPDGSRVLVREHVGADTERFLEAMSRLGDRAGPLVLQFPYFNRGAFPGPGPFLDRLAAYLEALPPGFRYAVEVRNKAWIGPPLLDLLRAHRVPLVLLDLAYMPHGAELAERFDVFTGDFAYLRLIGDRKKTEAACEGRFDRIVLDLGDRLQRWAELVAHSFGRVPETFAYANNHYAGHGPDTIRDLARRVAALVAESE